MWLGEGHMPGDPNECREHAESCLRLAAETHNPQAKETFESLAQTWLRLAVDLEAALVWGSCIDPDSRGILRALLITLIR
jgi:hypothetical protein